VRDRDVGLGLLRERLERESWMPPAPAGQVLECYEDDQKKARRRLTRDVPKLAHQFEQAAKNMVHELRAGRLDLCGQPASLGALAAAVLSDKLERLATAGRNDLSDADNVHQLRIAAKRLRYAMEVFAGCYPDEFKDDLYVAVEHLQGELGELNDLRHLYGAVLELRPGLLAHRGSDERDEVKSLLDRFTASLAHEWINGQEYLPAAGPGPARAIRALATDRH